VTLGVTDGVTLGVTEGVTLGVTEGVTLGVTDGVGVTLGVTDGVTLGVTDGVGVTLGVIYGVVSVPVLVVAVSVDEKLNRHKSLTTSHSGRNLIPYSQLVFEYLYHMISYTFSNKPQAL
jgi:hypothetical protein